VKKIRWWWCLYQGGAFAFLLMLHLEMCDRHGVGYFEGFGHVALIVVVVMAVAGAGG